MDISVLDSNFKLIYIVDAYKSLIWTDRFNKSGDFELYTEVSGKTLSYITKDCYLTIKGSKHAMIVSDIMVLSDRELGNYIKITGHSLEQILDRRIVWGQRDLNTSLQNGIKILLNENIISPKDSSRRIPNFIFQESSDPKVVNLKMNNQYTGDNLYDIVTQLCSDNEIGFQILMNDRNQFVFSLYSGKDRSYDQTVNPYCMFSPKYENLLNSNYYESNFNLKNVTLIAGQGEGDKRIYTTYGSKTGLSRRELFTDARGLSSQNMSSSQYLASLQERGKEKLAENQEVITFDGEVEPNYSFVYMEDYDVGDIVQIENEYGQAGTTRITEVITSHDENGYSVYPSFEMIGINRIS